MSESDSFTSLMALVDSHLSKTSMSETTRKSDIDDKITRAIQIPSTVGVDRVLPDSIISPSSRLQLPNFGVSSSGIGDVLAEQISNMLLAKEKKKQEEKLEQEMKKLKVQEDDPDDYIIDLMSAIQVPGEQPPPIKQTLSSSSSLGSLLDGFSENFDCDSNKASKPTILNEELPEELPCKTDMSYILKQKIRRGKCSAFGKVLVAKYMPVAAPYLRMKIESNVVPFDFKTPSPCDINLERRRRPTTGNKDYVSPMHLVMG